MAPPTANDPWLAGRRFGVVVDAGSSGSRLQIYSWKDPRTLDSDDEAYHALPKVEKGVKEGEGWVSKVEPGISSFAASPDEISTYLAPLLAHASDTIPPSLHSSTPFFLLATAGMRLLAPSEQTALIQSTCDFLRFHSNFRIDEPSSAGPCGSSVRIISGEEEGLFGWISVNYLMDGFRKGKGVTTYGFLDMGGASTQIAFEPAPTLDGKESEEDQSLIDVRLRLVNGEEVSHKVFVTTWLGYGTNQARERYVAETIQQQEQGSEDSVSTVSDPCLPKSLQLSSSSTPLVGTGSFSSCLLATSPLLNKSAPCPAPGSTSHRHWPCLFNGQPVPPIDFTASHFIGVSEYWYSTEHIFGLGGVWDVVEYEKKAEEFCGREWTDIVAEFERGWEGSRWAEKIELGRLEMQCFKAAWLVNMLHEGVGMPRIVDKGGNPSEQEGQKVAEHAIDKGVAAVERPMFQSVDTVGDVAISWTLGKMVLEASKEVPPLSAAVPPIKDPMESAEAGDTTQRPPKPNWGLDFPFDLDWGLGSLENIDDRLENHLPASLSRESLGFSPAGVVLCFLALSAFLLVGWRLRKNIRAYLLRIGWVGVMLGRRGKRSVSEEDEYLMEGGFVNGNGHAYGYPSRPTSPTNLVASLSFSSRISSRWLSSLRRWFNLNPSNSRSRSKARTKANLRPSPILTNSQVSLNGSRPPLRSAQTSPAQIFSLRSFSTPSLHDPPTPTQQHPNPFNSYSRSPSYPRSSTNSPSTSTFPLSGGGGSLGPPDVTVALSSLGSISRNSSQMNLSSCVPRNGAISRAGSVQGLGVEGVTDISGYE